jgi:hypothetical protein
MKRSAHWVVGLLALILMASAPLALHGADKAAGAKKKDAAAKKEGAKKKAGKKAKSGIQGYYAIIAKMAELTDQQKADFEKAIKARKEAMDKWDTQNKGAAAKLKEEAGKAKKDGNTDKAKEIGGKLKKLMAARKEIDAKTKKDIFAVLTEKQRAQMAGFNLYTAAMRKFNKLDLTDKQKASAKELAMAQGKTAYAAESGSDKKALATIRNAYYAQVEKDVLPDAQRAKAKELNKAKAKPKKGDDAKKKKAA